MTSPADRSTANGGGTFDIVLTPVPHTAAPHDSRGRMTFTKTFQGALQGRSDGEMLTAGQPARGSAGYVAMERFEGTLDGRRGSFVMQHSGTMDSGADALAIVIAPGSGTGELAGIGGTATIDVRDGQHHYTLHYTLPAR
ncbi:uncharacterized protein DUF3224 [Pseudoduganella lurida]|uniref:Uncharacterized protein DUF3224 n=1 Tax=Pseudoduganella lurida TaxID=1036180 RepID=A0A562RF53_9BURK|nr:DUF3224 domain-containing protein [Pseudoduganella lurida]TWI67682.1 uncharacterized protein DUF3224 [Pseudoduganella lurida]